MNREQTLDRTVSQDGRPCFSCAEQGAIDIDFTYAFQPIVDITNQSVHSYEALARGPGNESAKWVLDQVTPDTQ